MPLLRRVFALLSAVVVPLAVAAPGDFDTSFATGGLFRLPSNNTAVPGGVASLFDGRVLFTGQRQGESVVGRLLPSGLLDPSFASPDVHGGSVSGFFLGFGSSHNPVALQDGGVLAFDDVYTFCGPPCRFTPTPYHMGYLIRRTDRDGNLASAAMPPSGVRMTSPLPGAVVAHVSGVHAVFAKDFTARGFAADHTADTFFAQRASAVHPCPPRPGESTASSSDVVAAGTITGGYVAAYRLACPGQMVPALWVVRYRADGSPDPAFAVNGVASTASGDFAAMKPLAVLVRDSGEVFVVMATDPDLKPYRVAVHGFNPAGQALAPIVMPVPLEAIADIALQPDGKFLVAGFRTFGVGLGSDPALARMNANGTPDSGFGPASAGFKSLAIGGGRLMPKRVVPGPSGLTILVSGRFALDGSPGWAGGDIAVARLIAADPPPAPPIVPTPTGGGGGGCGITQTKVPVDPVFPALLALALAALAARRRRTARL